MGVHYTTVAGPVEKYPAAGEFATKFKTRYGKTPESFALYSHDAAQVLLAAIEAALKEAGGPLPTRKAVSAAVRAVKLTGITGEIAFDTKGDRLKSDYYVMKLEEPTYPGKAVKVISAAPPGG